MYCVGDTTSQSGRRGRRGEGHGLSYTRRRADPVLLRAVRRVYLRRLRVPTATPRPRCVHVLRGYQPTPPRTGRSAGEM